MADIAIKPDPDVIGASPSAFAEDDVYEDAGDLEFNTDPKYQKLYLARLPTYIWDNWHNLDNDAEIQLGTIRMSHVTDADGNTKVKLQMLLNADLPQHKGVPKEYELDVANENVKKTFIFTEQDLPGYKSRANTKFDPATANMPARLNKPKLDRNRERQPWDKNKKYLPYISKGIPKKTALLGRVAHELNCVAVVNEESNRILAERTIQAMKPKAGTKFIKGDAGSLANGFIQPGTVRAQDAFSNFIKDTGTSKSKATAQDTKTARIPQNELLDRIFGCFRKYTYWSMKSLRTEVQQPEAYIRETIDKIAEMPKSGRFAMHWTLKPEFATAATAMAKEGSAPTTEGDLDGVEDSDLGDLDGEGDDDEDVKMEDVLHS